MQRHLCNYQVDIIATLALMTLIRVWMLLFGASTFAWWYIRKKFSFWTKRGVAFRNPHWLCGNFGDWLKVKISSIEIISSIYQEFRHERFCGLWRLHTPTLLVIEPDLIREILVKDFDTWSERGLPFNPQYDPLSATLVNLNGKEWKVMRTKLSPIYAPVKLKRMFQLLLEIGEDFDKYLETRAAAGGIFEAKDMCSRLVTDINGLCALGIKLNSLNGDSPLYQKLKRQMLEPTLTESIIDKIQVLAPGLFKFLRLTMQSRDLNDYFLNIVRQNFEYREKNGIDRQDFVDLLRSLKNTGEPLGEDEIEFDDKLLAAQAFDFFLGGFESASGLISYCLHELAFNKDIQNRLRREVHITKAAHNGEITWDSLNDMEYLDMVVQETFRKYPTAAFIMRQSTKPYLIPNTEVVLPSGMGCIIPVYALHHDPEYFPDPEKFDPERFTYEAKSQRQGFTFLPFGAGPRNCVGLRFGEHQVKVALIKLLDKFEVSFCEKTKLPLEIDPNAALLFFKDGIWLRVSKISAD